MMTRPGSQNKQMQQDKSVRSGDCFGSTLPAIMTFMVNLGGVSISALEGGHDGYQIEYDCTGDCVFFEFNGVRWR